MTTWKLNEDAALAAALTRAIEKASPDAVAALTELRSCATPGNGFHLAAVPWEARGPVALALRAEAAVSGGEMAAQLEGIAAGLLESLEQRMAHQI